jgi:hypothetical protein
LVPWRLGGDFLRAEPLAVSQPLQPLSVRLTALISSLIALVRYRRHSETWKKIAGMD